MVKSLASLLLKFLANTALYAMDKEITNKMISQLELVVRSYDKAIEFGSGV